MRGRDDAIIVHFKVRKFVYLRFKFRKTSDTYVTFPLVQSVPVQVKGQSSWVY